MEGVDIAGVVVAGQIVDALAHLVRGLVGERHAQQISRQNAQLRHQIREPARQRPRLAGARARDHAHEALGRRDRLPLRRVQPFEQIHIRTSCPSALGMRTKFLKYRIISAPGCQCAVPGAAHSDFFLHFYAPAGMMNDMKKRVAYYVSRKNPLIWLAALVMLASAALRIANVCGKGADARTVWLLVVLPVAACVFYVLNILCNGKGPVLPLVRPRLPACDLLRHQGHARLALSVADVRVLDRVSGHRRVLRRDGLRPCQEHDPAAASAAGGASPCWPRCTRRNFPAKTGTSCGRSCRTCCSCSAAF